MNNVYLFAAGVVIIINSAMLFRSMNDLKRAKKEAADWRRAYFNLTDQATLNKTRLEKMVRAEYERRNLTFTPERKAS